MGLTTCIIIDRGLAFETLGDGSLSLGIIFAYCFAADSRFAHSDIEVLSLEVMRLTHGTFLKKVCSQVEFGVPTSQLLVQSKKWRSFIYPMLRVYRTAWSSGHPSWISNPATLGVCGKCACAVMVGIDSHRNVH